jgi:hypothetical protein
MNPNGPCRLSIAAAVLLFAPAVRAHGAASLHRIYHLGDVDRYRVMLKAEAPGSKLTISLSTTDEVTDIRPDGSYEITTTVDAGSIDVNGMEAPFPGVGQSLSLVTDRAGIVRFKESATRPHRGEIGRLVGLTRILFVPAGELKAGMPYPFATLYGNRKVAGSITVLGTEKPGGDIPVETMRLHTAADMTDATGVGDRSGHLDTVAFIDPLTGIVCKQTGIVTGITLPDAGIGKVIFSRIRSSGAGATRSGRPHRMKQPFRRTE